MNSKNKIKAETVVSNSIQSNSTRTNNFESSSVLNHSISGVTEPFNRIVNLPSTAITPAFGVFKLSQEVAVFRTAMSLINTLKPKLKAIENVYSVLRENSDEDGIEATRKKVHELIAKRVGEQE